MLPAPFAWLPECPDASLCHNSMLGFLKVNVVEQCYQVLEDFQQAARIVLNVPLHNTPEIVPQNLTQTYNLS